MFNVVIAEDYDLVSSEAFKIMRSVLTKDKPVLGLATGSSPVGLYKKMIADHNSNNTSYKNVITFNLDEYIGIPRNHEQSYYTFMHENLFDSLNEFGLSRIFGLDEIDYFTCVRHTFFLLMNAGSFGPVW